MVKSREILVQTRLTEREGIIVQHTAKQRGLSVAGMARETLLRAAEEMFVDGWSFENENAQEEQRLAMGSSGPYFRLKLTEVKSRELVCEYYDCIRPGQFSGPCSSTLLSQRNWFKNPDSYRIILRGSGVWKLMNVLDVTHTVESTDERPISILFLQWERPAIRH